MATSILIVDDHAGFRASARRLLESQGYSVVGEAEDGSGAVGAASELRPDVALVDVYLGDCDGRDLARELTALREPPTVVLISSRDPNDICCGGATPTGAAGFISKGDLAGPALEELLA